MRSCLSVINDNREDICSITEKTIFNTMTKVFFKQYLLMVKLINQKTKAKQTCIEKDQY